MKDLIVKYKELINTLPHQREGCETSPEHISWMLDEMSSMTNGSNKLCRWFGFVHFSMFNNGLIKISPTEPFSGLIIKRDLSEKKLSIKPIKNLLSRYMGLVKASCAGGDNSNKISNKDIYLLFNSMLEMDFDDPLFHLSLGFAQSAMFSRNLIIIKDERELTRAVF